MTAAFLLELAADPELLERHKIVALAAHLAVGYDGGPVVAARRASRHGRRPPGWDRTFC
jgi:hypothetical protein